MKFNEQRWGKYCGIAVGREVVSMLSLLAVTRSSKGDLFRTLERYFP